MGVSHGGMSDEGHDGEFSGLGAEGRRGNGENRADTETVAREV